MKIVVYSDPHQHEYKTHAWTTEDGLNSRVEDVAAAVEKVYEYAEGIGAPVVFGGDMFQVKGTLPVTGFNKIYKIISRRFDNGGLADVMIPGNHDMATADGKHHALEVFNEGDCKVFGEPTVCSPWDGIVIAAIPFPMVNGKFNDRKFVDGFNTCLTEIQEQPDYKGFTRILLSHCFTHELMGKHLGVLGDIKGEDLLEDFDLVLLGHHHIHDTITKGKKKLLSIGAPIQHTFNDIGETRGFAVIDTETLEIEHVPIKCRQFWSFDGEKTISADKAAGSFIRCRVSTKAEGERAKKELVEAGAASVVIELIPKTPKKRRLDLEAGAKDSEILKKFLDSEYCETELDKDRLFTLATEYLEKCV